MIGKTTLPHHLTRMDIYSLSLKQWTLKKCCVFIDSLCIFMHIGYVPRERPPFSALNFHSGAYHFLQITPKNPFRSIAILHFLADFAVPETIIFKMSLISTRSSPPTAGSARTHSAVPRVSSRPEHQPDASWQFRETRIFTLKTDQARSGAPHFKLKTAQASSFRRPRSFTLDRELVPDPGVKRNLCRCEIYDPNPIPNPNLWPYNPNHNPNPNPIPCEILDVEILDACADSPIVINFASEEFRATPGPFFTLLRHIYLPKFGVSTPPPPVTGPCLSLMNWPRIWIIL